MSADSKAERLANAEAHVRHLQRELAAAQRRVVRLGGKLPLPRCCAHYQSALGLIKSLIEGRGFRSVEREVLQVASECHSTDSSEKP